MTRSTQQLVICVSNAGFETSLERRKVYLVHADPAAAKLDLMRVVDESGESYLYPKAMFVAVKLPQAVRRAVLKAA